MTEPRDINYSEILENRGNWAAIAAAGEEEKEKGLGERAECRVFSV